MGVSGWTKEECIKERDLEWVRAHYDKNGVYIRGYCRRRDGSYKESRYSKPQENKMKEEAKKLQWRPAIPGSSSYGDDYILAPVKLGNKNGVLIIYKEHAHIYNGWDKPDTVVPNGARYELRIEKPGKKWNDPNDRYAYDSNTQRIMRGRTYKNGDDVIKYIAYKKYKDIVDGM